MRLIGQLPDETAARRFVDYLVSRRVAAHAEQGSAGWQIWVEHDDQLDAARAAVLAAAERSRGDDREAFLSLLGEDLEAEAEDVAVRMRQAAPPDQLWLGMERYWRKRRERDE